MTTFTVITSILCLVGVQINAQYAGFENGDLYAESTIYTPRTYGSSSGYGLSGSSGFNHKGGIGGYNGGSSFGLHGHGKSLGGLSHAGKGLMHGSYKAGSKKVLIPPGYGSKGFGASTFGSKKGGFGSGFGSSILGSTQGATNGLNNGCGCGAQHGASGFGTQNLGSPNPMDEVENVGAPNPMDDMENGDESNPSDGAEDVGSPYPGSFDHHHNHHHNHGPPHGHAYPYPPPPVKCGSNLLISCKPTSQVVPCSSYSPPSYGPTY